MAARQKNSTKTKSKKKKEPKTDALSKFKYEVANELGVSLGNNVSSKDAGKVGGNMVKKMIQQAESQLNK